MRGKKRLSWGLALLVALAVAAGMARAACPEPATPPHTATPVPPDDKPEAQVNNQRVDAKLAAGSYRVITFGDSIMHGWKTGMESVTGGPVLNAALGAGTGRVLWELETKDWSKQSPETVILLIGTNNLNEQACDVFWGIQADVRALHAHFPKARLFVVSILPRGENLQQFADKIMEIDGELKRAAGNAYTYVDAHDAFLCGNRTPCALYKPGNLHLTPQGYAVLTPILAQAYKSTAP